MCLRHLVKAVESCNPCSLHIKDFFFFPYFRFLPWANLSVLFSTGLPVDPALQHIYKFDNIFFPMGNDEMEMLE